VPICSAVTVDDARALIGPNLASQHDPESIRHMESEYSRVKHRFMNKGKDRNNWCRLSLRDMAKEIGAEGIYGGIYGFTSSMTHGELRDMFSQTELARAALQMHMAGHAVPTHYAIQLRNWAVCAEDSVLSLYRPASNSRPCYPPRRDIC
jgi:hypothetical protein